jgi:CRP-like cAMP-binding protein
LNGAPFKFEIMISASPFQKLFANVSQFVPLPEVEFQEITRSFRLRPLKKKEHLLTAGSLCTEVFYVLKGGLRLYYPKDGAEQAVDFFFEDSWFTDFESWLTKKPSTLGLDALEDCEIISIPFRDLYTLYDLYPTLERIGRLIAEQTIIRICNRSNSLLADSPQERYIKLLEEHPDTIDRVPQYYIASYLGIEPESLSRIRKKISGRLPA